MNGNVIKADDFDVSIIPKFGVQSPGKGRRNVKIRYFDCVCAFDIETTRLSEIEQSFMYIWQFQVDEYCTIIGRTWHEFISFVNRLNSVSRETRLVVYVHNLSYEMQFLQGIFDFSSDDIFCIKSRVILKAILGCIEFRCSYKLSNMSLSEYCSKMQVANLKLSGFDYSKIRYSDTPLTEKELQYCINDVIGLVQAVKRELEIENDNLYTIPLTSTGYVRREAKSAMRHFPKNELKNMMPDFDVYRMLRRAFRGGDTHANRYYVDDKIVGNIYSYDRASSYPHVQLTKKFPMGKFRKLNNTDINFVMDLINRRKKAVIMDIVLFNYRLRDRYWPNPPLSKHKCRIIDDSETIEDNGRILKCACLETTFTDIDFNILLETTSDDTDITILDGYYTHYGYLPKPFRDVILKYFRLKCELKNVDGQEVYYMKSKNKLNSFYGMSAQNPVRDLIFYWFGSYMRKKDFDNLGTTIPDELQDMYLSDEEQLEKYNAKSFLPYQWGVYTTAWARYELYKMQKIAYEQSEALLYWDTDSVKFLGKADFTQYNNDIILESVERKAYVDYNKKRFVLGVAELDGEYVQFKTLGAKKYCYVEKRTEKSINPSLHLTCAGVNKKIGALELACYSGIDSFKEGFVFTDSGGLEAHYNDDNYGSYKTKDGKIVNITRNVSLSPSSYTLGLTNDYRQTINYSREILAKYERNC